MQRVQVGAHAKQRLDPDAAYRPIDGKAALKRAHEGLRNRRWDERR